MPVSEEFSEFLSELLTGLGEVSIRRMFGGAGLFMDGLMFGLIADDVLYLKADDRTIPESEAEGMAPFVYEGKGKPISMSYWRVPDRLMDEPDELTAWARKAFGVAQRARK